MRFIVQIRHLNLVFEAFVRATGTVNEGNDSELSEYDQVRNYTPPPPQLKSKITSIQFQSFSSSWSPR